MKARHRLATALALVGALVPSSATGWEFGMVGEQTFWTGMRDMDRKTQLVFFCTQAMPGIVQLQVFTSEPGPAEPVAVELSFTTSEGSFGPIGARATSNDGNLNIATTGLDLAAMNAVQSIYAEAGDVALHYYESTWHYPGANYADAFGAMLNACG